VHQKNAAALALTAVKNEDQREFAKLVDSFKNQFNEGSRVQVGMLRGVAAGRVGVVPQGRQHIGLVLKYQGCQVVLLGLMHVAMCQYLLPQVPDCFPCCCLWCLLLYSGVVASWA
jgi:hypothetical protein